MLNKIKVVMYVRHVSCKVSKCVKARVALLRWVIYKWKSLLLQSQKLKFRADHNMNFYFYFKFSWKLLIRFSRKKKKKMEIFFTLFSEIQDLMNQLMSKSGIVTRYMFP